MNLNILTEKDYENCNQTILKYYGYFKMICLGFQGNQIKSRSIKDINTSIPAKNRERNA